MRRLLLAGLTGLALTGCNDACEQRCEPLETFYDDCADELESAGVLLQCYDDEVDAYEDGSLDQAYARACTDGTDLADSCLRVSRARAAALEADDNADRLKRCQQEDPWIRAVRRGDCQGAIDATLKYGE
jgi:hypothetical protein